jgi:hypothetical protein
MLLTMASDCKTRRIVWVGEGLPLHGVPAYEVRSALYNSSKLKS